MVFKDFNSAFNTIIPQQEAEHAGTEHLSLQLDLGLFDWETSVSQDREQHLQHHRTEYWGPQGYVLSTLLFTLLTHNCAAMHSTNHIIKFTDDMIMVGLISKNVEFRKCRG